MAEMENAQTAANTVQAVVDGGKLCADIIKLGFKHLLTDQERKVAVGVLNQTRTNWHQGSVYFDSGTSGAVLPYFVKSGHAFIYAARKKEEGSCGVVGVITYRMHDPSKRALSHEEPTVAIMFSVPYSGNNRWNATVYSNRRTADHEIFKDLYGSSYFEGNDSWEEKNVGEYTIRGAMNSSSRHCIMMVHVIRRS